MLKMSSCNKLTLKYWQLIGIIFDFCFCNVDFIRVSCYSENGYFYLKIESADKISFDETPSVKLKLAKV